jgi:phosphatidylglycerol:prolipoprotein diacylglycerol transferase
MVALAVIAGTAVLTRELRRSGLPPDTIDAATWGVMGGLVGAKLFWSIEHWDQGPFFELFFSRGGLSWFGGFAGGLTAGVLVIRRKRLPILAVLSAATPALAIGHAIGRIGCFLVGDDYGYPTSLPWGVAFPEGLPPTFERVHPTQLYEAFALVPLALLLMRWRREQRPDAFVLGMYLVLAGTIRFAIEFIRVREPLLGPLAPAHLLALVAIAAGFMFVRRAR